MSRLISAKIDHEDMGLGLLVTEQRRTSVAGHRQQEIIAKARTVQRQPWQTTRSAAVADLLQDDSISMIAVGLSEHLVWSSDVLSRIHGLGRHRNTLLVTPLGLNLSGRVLNSVYSTVSPSLWTSSVPDTVVDSGIDFYVLIADALRSIWDDDLKDFQESFESELIRRGYAEGMISLFDPTLHCTVTGDLLTRDGARFATETVDTRGCVDQDGTVPTLFGKVPVAQEAQDKETLPEAHRRAIQSIAPELSLTVIVRTEYTRMPLLQRLLASLTEAALMAETTIEVVLVSSEPTRPLREYPDGGALRVRQVVSDDEALPPRTRNLLAGIEQASERYAWIVDDDDYVDPQSILVLHERLWNEPWRLLAVGSQVVEERWETLNEGRWQLLSSVPGETLPPTAWHRAFSGVNSLPVCGYVFPVKYAQERLKVCRPAANLSEDYALLLMLLTGHRLPEVEVVQDVLSYISKRAADSSVMWVQDRTAWAADIGEHVAAMQASEELASPGVWQLGRLALGAPAPSSYVDLDAMLQELVELRSRNEGKRAQAEAEMRSRSDAVDPAGSIVTTTRFGRFVARALRAVR